MGEIEEIVESLSSVQNRQTSIRSYYLLTKPGIIFGNVVTAAGGFALASKGQIEPSLFGAMLSGLTFIIASACVFNNYIDRFSDQKMARTRHRALAKGLIAPQNAILFGLMLLSAAISVLGFYTNLLTLTLALIGFITYVFFYSRWKYLTTHGTLIGSLAGAIPPVVGYCAVSNQFDLGAGLFFTILVLWQMPHFFSIAIYRLDDYTAAAIPVLPVKKGLNTTKVQMLLYITAFIPAAISPTLFGFTGYIYLTLAALLGTIWLYLCLKGFKAPNNKLWARQMFLFSIIVITALSITISMDN